MSPGQLTSLVELFLTHKTRLMVCAPRGVGRNEVSAREVKGLSREAGLRARWSGRGFDPALGGR